MKNLGEGERGLAETRSFELNVQNDIRIKKDLHFCSSSKRACLSDVEVK